MTDAEVLDGLFRRAVAAIDAGDHVLLERLLAEHPRLVRDRLESPGEWLCAQIGAATGGKRYAEIAAYLREMGAPG